MTAAQIEGFGGLYASFWSQSGAWPAHVIEDLGSHVAAAAHSVIDYLGW